MLVVSRWKDEVIKIGDDIEVMIVGIETNQVKIGVIAPRSVTVHRMEVWEKIERGKKQKGNQ